ncbi:PQQ-binding-like beta-propeller repeat protein [bacterium]|nr:PQQ-binding-like beta-propeller repeat protein [bacterium]
MRDCLKLALPAAALSALLFSAAGCGESAARRVNSGQPQASGLSAGEDQDWRSYPALEADLEQLMQRLASELRVPGPPQSPQSRVDDLSISQAEPGAKLKLSFSYRNSGDYNQDGQVAVSDLSSVGAFLGLSSTDSGWTAASVADGNADGLISSQDLAPIGANLRAQVDGYFVERRNFGQPPGQWSRVAEISGQTAMPPPGGGPLLFSAEIDSPGGDFEFRVTPFYRNPEGLLLGGIEGLGLRFQAEDGTPALGTPLNVQASAGLYGDRVQISWQPVPGASRHLVYRDGGPPIAILGQTSAYADFAVADYLAHEYFVRAEDGERLSEPSASATGFLGQRPGWPLFGGNPRHSGQSMKAGPLQPQLHWTWDIHDYSGRCGPVVAMDGSICIGGLGGVVYCAWPTGFLRWASPLGQGIEIEATPAISPAGTVLAGASDGKLHALELVSGELQWVHDFPEPIRSSVNIGPLGRIYLQNGLFLYCLAPTGVEIWRERISHSALDWRCSPAIGPDGTVYVNALSLEPGSLEGYTHAVSADGELLWSFPSGALGVDGASPAVSPEGTVYTSGVDKLHAINADGTAAWEYYTGPAPNCPAIAADGTVLVNGSAFYALSPEGGLRWMQSNISSQNFGSPLVDSLNNIYIPGGSIHSFTVFGLNGQIRWQEPALGTQVSQPVLGLDGALIIAAADGRVRCFRAP